MYQDERMDTNTNTNTEAIVEIPGTFYAHYEDGKITKFEFCPSGSSAGYFGPMANVVEGDEEQLRVSDTRGDFWCAVQDKLDTDPTFECEWSE